MKQAWRNGGASDSNPRRDGRDGDGKTPRPENTPSLVLRHSRIVKKLQPGQPGTMRLTRQYGEALVCVRYRQDATGSIRCTTIEVVVDVAPVHKRYDEDEIIGVRIGIGQIDQRRRAQARGARWDAEARLWRMTRKLAKRLNLTRHIVKT